MRKLLNNCLGKLWNGQNAVRWSAAAFIFLAALAAKAQPAPANDNFANATQLTGIVGTITGSNVGATAQPGEPDDAGNPGGPYHSIWYVWISTTNGTVEFNTEGSSFDTVMGVYQGTNVTSLTSVAQNDDVNFPSDLTSQVSFIVTNGGVYYVSIDGHEGATGSVTLNWLPVGGPNAGQFSFATVQTSENGLPLYVYTPHETDFTIQESDMTLNGARARLTRTGGHDGLVHVTYSVTNGFYTNTFITNIFGTNIYIVDTMNTNNFTNILSTNYAVSNIFSIMQYGIYYMATNSNGITITITNQNGASVTNITNYASPLPVPFPCANTTNIGTATNSTTGDIIMFTTNVFCTNIVTNILTPTAIAITPTHPSGDYVPVVSNVVDFRDYQMGADIPVDLVPNDGNLTNRIVIVTLNSVVLDSNEPTSVIAPPSIGTTNALVNVLSQETMPYPTNLLITTNLIFNFDKTTYTCTRTVNGFSNAFVWVIRGGTDASVSGTIQYRIDYSGAPYNNGSNGNNYFFPQPGSDYAIPAPPGTEPVPSQPADFSSVSGTVTLAPYQPYVSIEIPIFDNGLVEFNDDLQVELLNPSGGALGQVSNTVLTILFDHPPAGAIDEGFNPENNQNTSPPFNLNPGANKSVYACLIQPDGRPVIGGNFTAYNTTPRNSIARINTNGSLDTTFLVSPNSGANGTINCLAIDTNNLIYIGGSFTSFNGTNRYGIARLNTDGSLDPTFNPGVGVNGVGGTNGTVWAMALQPNGQLVIAGAFTTFNGTNCNNIVRLNTNGTLDTTFNAGAGPNGTVNAVLIQTNGVGTNGAIIIAGSFSQVEGAPRQSLARLNSDGSLDTSFNPGVGTDANTTIYALAEQANGQVYVGGSFNTFNLINSKSIARLNTDGSLDQSFSVGQGADDSVYSIAIQPDGNIVVGGLFTSYNQTRRVGVARLFSTGALDTSFMDVSYNQFAGLVNTYYNTVVQPKNFAYCVALQLDGNVLIAGSFDNIGGGTVTNVIGTSIPDRAGVAPRQNFARLVGGSTPGPGNIGLANTNYSADEDGGNAFVSITRNNGHLAVAGATMSTVSGSPGPGVAVNGVDYTFDTNAYGSPLYPSSYGNSGGFFDTWQKGDGVFGPNNKPVNDTGVFLIGSDPTIDINIIETGLVNGNHSFNVELSSPTSSDVFFLGGENIPIGAALDATATAPMEIINDNAPHGTISFSSATYTVDENATNAIITVIRTGGSAGQVTVQALTVPGGTATEGSTNDYLSVSNTLTFQDSVTNVTFSVPLVDNGQSYVTLGGQVTVNLALTNVSGGGIPGLTNAVLTIINNNFQPGFLQFTSTNFGVTENGGAAYITVSRIGGSAGSISVSCASSNGTATNGVNFSASTNILSWNAGDVSNKTFTVPVFHDGLVTSNLTVNLSLFNPVINGSVNNLALGLQSNAVLTITNIDFYGHPTLSASAYSVNENAGFVTVTVNRIGGGAGTMSVNYATSDGTAFQNVNYTPQSGTLTFAPGVYTTNIIVPIIDADANPPIPNGNTYFNITLSSPTPASGPGGGASLGNPSTAAITIIDNLTYNWPAGGVDTSFSGYFNDTVYCLDLQTNGQLLAGGDFTLADGITRGRIARLNDDGTLDDKFGDALAGADNSVRVVVVQTDGAILIGGLFANVDSVNDNGIARLNYDGSLDSTFNPGSGADGPVYGIAETFVGPSTNSANRRIVIGGSFASINGVPAAYVAQLNEDGSVDTTFSSSGANGNVFAVTVYSTNDVVNGGKILIGGDFTQVNGVTRNHIARLNADGTLDSSFNPGAGPNGSVRAIAVQGDGNIVIGGVFTMVGNTALNYIGRLTPNGLLDSSFNPGLGLNNIVTCVAIEQDGKIVVGGGFTLASGLANNSVTRNRLTRLNSDGSLDPSINFGSGANDFVSAALIQPDGRIVIGGGFTQFDGDSTPYIARLYGLTTPGPGTLTFSAANYQVDANGTNVVITVQRDGGTSDSNIGNVYVQFSTSDGTATSGQNYIGVTNTLTFPVGEVFEYVTIPILSNAVVESNLTVDLTLSNPTDAALGAQPTAVLTIVNVNSDTSFSTPTYYATKGNTTGEAVITLFRTGSSVGVASVDLMTTTNGTAISNLDYVPYSNTVYFADGAAQETVNIEILTNSLAGSRTVGLMLLNPSNTVLANPSAATLTILDNTTAAGDVAFASTNYIVSDSQPTALINLIRTNGFSGEISVTCVVGGGTATAGVDYAPTNIVIDFFDEQTNASFSVPLLYDSNATPNLTVNMTLTNVTGGAEILPPATVPLTIISANTGFAFDQQAYFVDETNGSVTITVDRIGSTNGSFTVQYATTNGTALNGTNYLSASGTLTFSPGQTFQTFQVPVVYDPQITGNLTFFIQLSNPSAPGQLVNPTTTAVTVIDDNTGLSLASATNAVNEFTNSIQIPVLRTGNTVNPITVNFSTSDGTATNGVSYFATNGTLTFQAGQTSNSFAVGIIDNNLVLSNTTFNVFLSNPSTGVELLSPTNEVITVIDDNSAFSFSSSGYSVAENGVVAPITVVRRGVTNTTVSVNFATSNLTANSAQYIATNGTLTFTNGQTSATFNVGIINANVTGGSETVALILTNATPATNTSITPPNQAILTIFNDDGSLIIPAGSYLISGGSNNVIYSGDTVTMLLALRNSAGTNTTTNFQATLLATNGISSPSPSGPVKYGMLVTNGPSVSELFTFTATATNGSQVSATLQLQDGTNNLGYALFTFGLGQSTTYYSNTNSIIINPGTNATPYPSTINVATLGGQIDKVTTTISNLGSYDISGVSVLLVGPGGQPDLLMGEVGGVHTITNVTLTLDASVNNYLGTNQPVAGTYAPSAFSTTIPFPGPAPSGPYPTNYSNLLGGSPNGTWSLYVFDDELIVDPPGIIGSGWGISISALNVLEPTVDLIVGMTASTNIAVVGSNLTYTITVTNCGPAPATGVFLTNLLPAGATLVSSNSSQGTGWSLGASNTLICSLGNLPTNVVATATLVITPPASDLGLSVTNTVIATANETDAYTGDNTASVVTAISGATANLVVSLTDTPDPVIIGNTLTYTITVTNNGPATAPNVLTTNFLPPGVTITNIPLGGTVGTNLGFVTVTYGLGTLGSGSSGSFVIKVVAPSVPGLITNIVGIGSSVLNPLQSDNFASVKTQVIQVQLGMSLSGNTLSISWPNAASGYTLQSSPSLTPPVWSNVSGSPINSGGQYMISLPLSAGPLFFRLIGPAP